METHCSILAWRIPWTEEPGELQSKGSQRVRHDWSTLARMRTYVGEPLCCISETCGTSQINYTLIFFNGFYNFLFKGTRAAEANRIERFRLQREIQKCTQDHQSTPPVYKTGGRKALYFDGGVGYMMQSFLKIGVSWTHHICAFQHIWIITQFKIQLLIKGL